MQSACFFSTHFVRSEGRVHVHEHPVDTFFSLAFLESLIAEVSDFVLFPSNFLSQRGQIEGFPQKLGKNFASCAFVLLNKKASCSWSRELVLGLNERRKNNKKIHEKNCVYFFMMSYYSGLNFFL